MKRLVLLGVFMALMFTNAAADPEDNLESKIEKDCGEDFEPVVSMPHPNKTINNIGHPSFYEYKVCVRGIIESEIAEECTGATAFYISSNTTKAHFANEKGYNLEVCTGNMETVVNNTCENSVPLFTISEKINGFGRHVAGLHPDNSYDDTVCGIFSRPENVTLGLEFNLTSNDDVYFDDEQIDGEFEDTSIAEFPYIIASADNVIAGIVAKDYRRISREIDTYNEYEVTKSVDDASYYIPLTSGTKDDLENSQEDFFDGDLENSINPTFSIQDVGTPVVRALAKQDVVMVTNLSVGAGSHSIEIEKTGDNEITIRER